WSVVVLSTVAGIELLVIAFLLSYGNFFFGFDTKTVTPSRVFQFKNSITCNIIHSTHHEGMGMKLPWHEIDSFELNGLDTETPTMKTAYYTNPLPLRKVYDTEGYIKLENAEDDLASNTIGILKENGNFVRSVTG